MIQPFEVKNTEIPGVLEITPFSAEDCRGALIKDYSAELLFKNGISYELKEVFYTQSHVGVLRGMHFQREYPQAKLVRCINGHVYDVVVDLRKHSPTFRKYLGFDLTGGNRKEILIPDGCAHGYLVLEDSIVSYKCSEKFYGEFDDGIRWDDPDLNINWKIKIDTLGLTEEIPCLSEKDRNLQSFQKFMNKYGGF